MLKINNLSKQIKKLDVLDNISFNVERGKFVTIFGPNGCGKSTLLSILAGLEKQTSGNFSIDASVSPKIGFVFQNVNDSMLPWQTTFENVALFSPNKSKIVEKLLNNVNLENFRDAYFCNLSGGMKQLTSICRTFAYDPDILLMDEPFSALDYSTARKMEMELMKIWEETKKTVLFVSHDIDETVFLADQIIVMSNKPSRIKGIINVNLKRPRNFECLKSDDFLEIRSRILNLFEYEE